MSTLPKKNTYTSTPDFKQQSNDLHVAIQDAMGWEDYHLHAFALKDPRTGQKVRICIPNQEFPEDILPEWVEKIANYFTMENKNASYEYDFGDDWVHKIQLEQIHPVEKGQTYPICLAGERACPPEDCGGVGGYEHILEVLQDPAEDADFREWIGDYDPGYFNIEEVEFDDPEERFASLFEDSEDLE